MAIMLVTSATEKIKKLRNIEKTKIIEEKLKLFSIAKTPNKMIETEQI